MAEVVLAQAGSQVWLVLGDEHIATVLLGELPEGVTVDFVTLENRAAVMTLWWKLNPLASATRQPWAINPLLVRRMRGLTEPGRRVIDFSPWSAMLNDDAQAAITDMASSGNALVLEQFAPADAQPGHADLQRLRLQLVRAALERAGLDPAAVSDRVVPATAPEQSERIDILAAESTL